MKALFYWIKFKFFIASRPSTGILEVETVVSQRYNSSVIALLMQSTWSFRISQRDVSTLRDCLQRQPSLAFYLTHMKPADNGAFLLDMDEQSASRLINALLPRVSACRFTLRLFMDLGDQLHHFVMGTSARNAHETDPAIGAARGGNNWAPSAEDHRMGLR